MPKFQMQELIGGTADTARLGAGTASNQRFNDKDAQKFVKLVGDSRYDLCAIGDEIEGRVSSVDTATSDGYSTGGVQKGTRFHVVFDGIQVDGSGSIAVGDYVVCGAVDALNTALTTSAAKVRKATNQATAKSSPFAWRVVAIRTGSGASGSTGTIERVNVSNT